MWSNLSQKILLSFFSFFSWSFFLNFLKVDWKFSCNFPQYFFCNFFLSFLKKKINSKFPLKKIEKLKKYLKLSFIYKSVLIDANWVAKLIRNYGNACFLMKREIWWKILFSWRIFVAEWCIKKCPLLIFCSFGCWRLVLFFWWWDEWGGEARSVLMFWDVKLWEHWEILRNF